MLKSAWMEVLSTYIDLGPSETCPLHAEALALEVSGALRDIDPGLSLCGMWTPAGYRSQLMTCGYAPDLSWMASPLSSGGSGVLRANEAAVLARFGDYDAIIRNGVVPVDSVALEIERNARQIIGQYYPETADRELIGTAFTRHACDVLLIASLVRKGRLSEARSSLHNATRDLTAWTEPELWLARFAELRLESIAAFIDYQEGMHGPALDRWSELAEAALAMRGTETVRNWALKDFARHRLSRVARHLIAVTSETAREVTSSILELDAFDARAWLLHGKAWLISDADIARQAFEFAVQLDPTVEPEASFLASRIAAPARAKLLLQRALDAPMGPLNKGVTLGSWEGPQGFSGVIMEWGQRAPANRAAWLAELYNPIIALMPAGDGPLFAKAPFIALARLQEADSGGSHWLPNIQRAVMPDMRREICLAARVPDFAVEEPFKLPPHRRSAGWSNLLDALSEWHGSSENRRTAILSVLLSIGMHRYAFTLLQKTEKQEQGLSDGLAYVYAFCEYILFAATGWFGYKPTAFERLAKKAEPGTRTAFMAALVSGVHYGKVEKAQEAAQLWFDHAQAHLQKLEMNWPSAFTLSIWRSRWHRANAFLPFLAGNRVEALEQLSLALRFNENAKVGTPTEALIQAENCQTIRQTIAKTALHFGNQETALEHALLYVGTDSLDGGGWLELGGVYFAQGDYDRAADAYLTSALLGPPGDRIGRYMAGEAALRGGKVGDAIIDFMASLTADPEGTSPRNCLKEIRLENSMFARLQPLFFGLSGNERKH